MKAEFWNVGLTISRRVVLVALAVILLAFASCQKDVVGPFRLTSIKVGTIDLSTTSPVGVPVTAVINADFSTGVDAGTVRSSISLTRDYDTTKVSLTVYVSRGAVTIRSNTNLTPGSQYTLKISSDLHSSAGAAFDSFTATFKTAGAFVPPGQVAYWSFESVADDVLGTYDPVTNGSTLTFNSYVEGRNVAAGQAAQFNGTTDIVEIANGTALLGKSFAISLWMKIQSAGHTGGNGSQKSNYVFGIGNAHGLSLEVDAQYRWLKVAHGVILSDDSTMQSVFQFYGNGLTYLDLAGQPDSIRLGVDNATTVNQGIGQSGIASLLDNMWAHVVFTFDGSARTRSLYVNGSLMYHQDFSLLDTLSLPHEVGRLFKTTGMKYMADTGLPPLWDDDLVFGFWQSKESEFLPAYPNTDAAHFKGLLDDIRIFSRSISALEVVALYADEKP